MVEITFVHDGAGKICLRRPKRTHTVVEQTPLHTWTVEKLIT